MKLVLDIVTYGLGNVLPRVLGFLLLPLFTHYLTPEDYGVIALLGWIGIMLTPIMSAGLGAGLAPQFFRPEFASRQREVIWTALVIVMVASLATLVAIAATEERLFAWLGIPVDARAGFRLGIVAMALSACLVPLQGNLQFGGRARAFTALTLVTTVGTLLLAIGLVVIMRRGVRGWFEAMIGGQIVALLLACAFSRSLGWPRVTRGLVRRLLVSGLALMPSTFFVFLLLHGNKWLLQEYHGLSELGVYNVAFNMGLMMSLVVGAIQSAWFPVVMAQRHRRHEALEKNADMFVWLALGLGVLNLWFGVAARPLMTLMTAPEFHSGYALVALAANAHVWAGLFYVAAIPLYFDGHENRQTAVVAIAILIYSVVSVTLVYRFGALGCAVATVAGFSSAAAMMTAYACFVAPHFWFFLRAKWRQLTGILVVWMGGGSMLYLEIVHLEFWPWLSMLVGGGGGIASWLLLSRSERVKLTETFAALWARLR